MWFLLHSRLYVWFAFVTWLHNKQPLNNHYNEHAIWFWSFLLLLLLLSFDLFDFATVTSVLNYGTSFDVSSVKWFMVTIMSQLTFIFMGKGLNHTFFSSSLWNQINYRQIQRWKKKTPHTNTTEKEKFFRCWNNTETWKKNGSGM